HSDAQIEIEEADVGYSPVLIVATIEDQHPFQIESGQVSRTLNRGISQIIGRERHVVQVRANQNTVVVPISCHPIAALGPTGSRIWLSPVESAYQFDGLAIQ